VEQPNEARHLRLQLQPATSCRRTHSWAFDSPKRRKPAYLTFRQITGTSFRLLVIADSAFGCEDLTGCDSLAMRGHIIALASETCDVARFAFAAELNSAADALEHGKLISLALTEVAWPILGPTNLAASLEAGKLFLKISAFWHPEFNYSSLQLCQCETTV